MLMISGFGNSILIFLIIVFSLYFIFSELKNKPLKIRLSLFICVIILFIVKNFLITQVVSSNTAIDSSLAAHVKQSSALVSIARSDRQLLIGINSYLSSGRDTKVLSEKISELLKRASGFYNDCIFFTEYKYDRHIKNFQEMGDELIFLAEHGEIINFQGDSKYTIRISDGE